MILMTRQRTIRDDHGLDGDLDQVDASDDEDSSDDDDVLHGGKVRGEAYEEVKGFKKQSRSSGKRKPKVAKKKKVSLYEAEDLGAAGAATLGLGDESASDQARRRREELHIPLAKRFALQQDDDKPLLRAKGGSKEVAFIPRDTKKKLEEEAKQKEGERHQGSKRGRRGVKDLGFKKPYRGKR